MINKFNFYTWFSNPDNYKEIMRMYSSPNRKYHTFNHIRNCLFELHKYKCDVGIDFDWEQKLMAAIVFHDCVYNVVDYKYNEFRSSIVAQGMLLLDVFNDIISDYSYENEIYDISHLIMFTIHDGSVTPETLYEQLISDIDLASLSYTWSFARQNRQIRQEFELVPNQIYYEKRIEFLEYLINRPNIYYTDYFHDKYEDIALDNLTEELRYCEYLYKLSTGKL